MKKFIWAAVILLIAGSVYAAAPDRRISDGDGDVAGVAGSGRLSVLTPGSSLVSGRSRLSVSGTAEVLAASQAVSSVILKGWTQNRGVLYIGGSTVTSSSGLTLDTGEVVEIRVDNLADIYFDGSVGGGDGDIVEYLGIVE